ncbi:MAG: Cna B-type domain-containing protein, partial [Clostridiales bacterium]|nr:Cna B-type domain-containing protein [Clostridiales bacterium]
TYDTAVYDVEVTINYDTETGVMTPAVVVTKDEQPYAAVTNTSTEGNLTTVTVGGLNFTNTYNASAKVVLKGTKQLLGHDLASDQFTFKLYSGTDTSETAIPIQTVKNAAADASGRKADYEFAPITYLGADIGQTFTYTLVEVNELAPGYTYDAAKYTVTVRIDYDIESGVMTPVVEVKKGGETVAVTTETTTSTDGNVKTVTIGAIPFVNEYWAEGTYTPVGTKALVDRDLKDGLFKFEVLDGSDVVSRGQSMADGSIVFEAITYHKNKDVDDTTAPHTYTIREIAGNDYGWDHTGIVYSTEIYTLTVTVVDNDDGTLSTSGVYALNDAQGNPTGETGEFADFHNTTQKVRFAVKKVWQDDAPYPHRPVEITVHLVGKAGDITVVDLSHTFGGIGNEWSYTFPDVPRYDYTDPMNSVLIVYTITEDIVTGYSTVILETGGSNDGQLFEVNYEITNTLRKFTVSKRSSGGGRLAGATLSLYKIEGSKRTLFDRWTTVSGKDHVVTGLEPGVYRLVETSVPADHVAAADITIIVAVDGTVTSSAMNSAGIVVMIDPLIPRANVTGTKTWIDLSNEKGKRPENITLTLYADEVPVAATPTWVKDGDVWTYTYANLLIYRVGNSGDRIVYRVEEAPVEGYEPTYNGLDIVNETTEVEIEYTSVSGTKTWVDDDDAAGARPDSITVYLLRNGSVYSTKVVTEADGWAYSFKNLPTSDGLTTHYTYSISEKMVPGYVRFISGSNLTNTYVPPEEPPRPPKKPPYTPENWENLITLLDEEVPLYGGLLKTGEKILAYPFVFAGIGLLAVLVVVLDRRKRKSRGSK